MAKIGLDNSFIKKMKKELDIGFIRNDQASDFFFLPQLDAIYAHCGDKLKDMVGSKLSKSEYGPQPPIEMEIPKSSRVFARSASIVGPNYFRPGNVFLPDDRVVYHFIAQQAEQVIEKHLDRTRVFSNRPLATPGEGFSSASAQWRALKGAVEAEIKSGAYKVVLKADVAQYFFSINQHELVNQLDHQGLPPEIVKLAERFFASLTLDRSSRGIPQGLYGSDLLGNGYLSSIDEFIVESGFPHYRYVDDFYVLFKSAEDFRSFFPVLVKRLRDYDLSLNESKTFASAPLRLIREETELDKAIAKAKEEAAEKLTDYEEIEFEGDYGDVFQDIIAMMPDEDEVELEATLAIFQALEDFKGEERDRAESFCLGFLGRASDLLRSTT